MCIGLDFDNIIVIYDLLFYKVVIEQGLVLVSLLVFKFVVCDYLCEVGQDVVFIELQGDVYGVCMGEVEVFVGVFDFICQVFVWGVELLIISYKICYFFKGL